MLTVTILCFVWRSYPGWSEELLNELMLLCRRSQLNFLFCFPPPPPKAQICCSRQVHQNINYMYQYYRSAVFRFAYSFQCMLLNQQECQVCQTAPGLFIVSIILWGLNNLEKRIITRLS